METFAQRLKRIRNERKYTQEKLGQISNIVSKTIQNYEQGKNDPSAYNLLSLAQALDVTPEYLLKGNNDMNNYTKAIKVELRQLNDFVQIAEIRKAELNSVILAHLELSEGLVSDIQDDWNQKRMFRSADSQSMDGKCYKNYVREIIIRYCQNRTKFRDEFDIQDGNLKS